MGKKKPNVFISSCDAQQGSEASRRTGTRWTPPITDGIQICGLYSPVWNQSGVGGSSSGGGVASPVRLWTGELRQGQVMGSPEAFVGLTDSSP